MVSEQTTNTIVELAKNGMLPRAIFERLNRAVSIGVIYKVLRAAKHKGVRLRDFRLGTYDVREILTKQVVAGLSDAARDRDCGIGELARRLLERIVEDGLVNAVLDDHKPRKNRQS